MNSNENVIITVRSNLLYLIRRKLQSFAYLIFGARNMSKIYYRIEMKHKLDLDNPHTFTEKINWYKLYYCPQNDLVIRCSDKYTVRSFLEEQGLGGYLSEIVGVWENPDEIQWNSLPNKFAMKNSNGCGYNIICNDKSQLNEKTTKKMLKKWLNEHFGYYNAEPHYEIGKKRIICEEYIESCNLLPVDYKVHCMNGEPMVLQLCDERTSKTTKYYYYDLGGNPFPFGKYLADNKIDLDYDILSEMRQVSKQIASHFPYVRVDFFINHGKLQISELTFSPSAGLKPDLNFNNRDIIMGEMLDFEEIMKYGKY